MNPKVAAVLVSFIAIALAASSCGGGADGPNSEDSTGFPTEDATDLPTNEPPPDVMPTDAAPTDAAQPDSPTATVVRSATTPVRPCDFGTPTGLRAATTYDISGQDAYDTLVCGFLSIVENAGCGKGRIFCTSAYLALVDFADEGFVRAVEEAIALGNTVNRRGPLYYEFRLGCYDNDTLESGATMDPQTRSAILASSPTDLVSVVLSFEKHGGRGCGCCSLAEEIRLY